MNENNLEGKNINKDQYIEKDNVILLISAIIIVCALAFSLGFTPMRTDNDVWWHLKAGKVITENNYKLPKYDVFTFTGKDIEWHNHEWLSQIIFYKIYQYGEVREIGGIRALVLFKSILLVLTALIIFIMILKRTSSLAPAFFASVIAVILLKRTIYVRPPVISYLLLALYIWVLYNVSEKRWGKKSLILLPVIMIPWANLHGGFLTGLIAIGSFWTDSLSKLILNTYRNRKICIKDNPLFIPLSLTLFISFLASLCTPYGINLYFLTGRVMSDINLVRSIPELHSPDFFFTISFEWIIIFCIIGFGFIRKRIFTLAEIMLFIFFFHQAIQHVRHITLFGIASAGIIGSLTYQLIIELSEDAKIRKLISYFLILITFSISVYSIIHHREGESFLERNLRLLNGDEYEKDGYPIELTNFILSNPFHGNMYNQINYGGYLIWRLSPEKHKVFTDSRFDVFGSKFIWDMMDIENGVDYGPDWRNYENLLDKYEINFVVVTRGAKLNSDLENNPKWRLVYFWLAPNATSTDNGYSIFVKNTKENMELINASIKCFEPIAASKRRPYPESLLKKVFGNDIL